MVKWIVFLCCLGLFFSSPLFGQNFLNGYSRTTNAAISGYNNKHLSNVSPEDCARACDNETSFVCKSFDYYKNSNACDLSSKSASDVGGLSTNYTPYDHYSRHQRAATNVQPAPAVQSTGSRITGNRINGYSRTPNAAISGYNNKHLSNVSPEDCARACDNERSFTCKSFDYYKNSNECDLSSKNASDVGGLSTNYPPYDHYSKSGIQTKSNSGAFETSSGDSIFSRWNKDACGYTRWSQFKLNRSTVIGKLFVWYHWRNNENNVAFNIINRSNQQVAQGNFKRGDCDPFQTQWCNAETILNIQLPAGEYAVQVSQPRICQNMRSNKKGYIQIKSSRSNSGVPSTPSSPWD